MSTRQLLAGAFIVAPIIAAALTGCDTKPYLYGDMPEDIALRSFSTCGELREYAEEAILEQLVMSQYGYYYGWGMMEDGDVAAADGATNSGPSDYTTTNVQEQGVDEVDIVKTDGNFLYITEDDHLYIVKSWPVEDSELVGQVDLAGYPYGLFIDDDQALVFSSYYDYDSNDPLLERSYSATRVSFIDISDRTDPTVTRTVDFEGYFADGRMIGSDAYLVLNAYLPLPEGVWDLLWNSDIELPEMDWEASESRQEQIRDDARDVLEPFVHDLVQDMDIEDILPLYRDQVTGAAEADAEAMLSCNNVYRTAELSQYSMMSVVHVDLDSGDIDSTGVMSNGWTIYASQDNIYVAQTSWWWWWGWGSMDMNTHIHKFELGEGAPAYRAAGAVDGWLLNQFSMSEDDGFLRVASTETDWWWGTGEDQGGNHVTILNDDNGHLVEVGSIRDIAPGEQIQGVRMMGDKGYIVTFEQIDPLWTVDLSNPYNPTIEGELEMPGFSTYLHPVGDDFLLAVGWAGDMDGNIDGLAVNLFDVSDFSDPQLADQFILSGDDWSYSEALWDHHAFTFHRGVLSIPVYSYDYDDLTGDYESFSGMLSLYVHPVAGITEIGRVDHKDLIDDSECYWDWGCEDDYYWYAWMRRSVYIEDNLFSISNYGVKVTELNDPESEIARVLYEPL